MSGKTDREIKEKYNKETYERYSVRVRKDSLLYEQIEEFMSKRGTSLNYLITKLLAEHFSEEMYRDD
jgi:hypothetical protein